MKSNNNFIWLFLLIMITSCATNKSIRTSTLSKKGITSRLQNINASFEQVENVLDIKFSKPIALKTLKIIVIKGAIVADIPYDGNPRSTIDLDLSKLPEGPLMFKFISQNGKELNEIFRIKNNNISEE